MRKFRPPVECKAADDLMEKCKMCTTENATPHLLPNNFWNDIGLLLLQQSLEELQFN